MSDDDVTKIVCPQCGNRYQTIAQHWAMSSQCDYPRPTAEQHRLIVGLLLAGASISKPANGHGTLYIDATNRAFLDWVDSQFDILSRGVSVADDADEASQELSALSGGTVDASTVYRWHSRTSPVFDEYFATWFSDGTTGERTPPPGLAPQPLALRVWYAQRGVLKPIGWTADAPRAVLNLHGFYTPEFLTTYLAPYVPVIWHEGDGVRLVLRDTEKFFTDIGFTPVPGCESKWPADDDPLATLATEETTARCPQCGGHFTSLPRHWARSSSCDTPPLSDRQRTILTAFLTIRGSIQQSEETQVLSAGALDERVVDWLSDELDWLVAHQYPDSNATDTYAFYTHAHPEFEGLRDDWYQDDRKVGPPTDLAVTPLVLQTWYAVAGVEQSHDAWPALTFGYRSQVPDDWLLDALADFQPTVRRDTDALTITIGDGDAFFEEIATAPKGLESKWPPSEDTHE